MKYLLGILGTAALLSVSSFADHGAAGGGSVDNLVFQGQELEQVVRRARLAYEVLISVQRFNDEVRTLDYCSSRGGDSDFIDLRPGFGPGAGHGPGPGFGCQGQLNRVERSFQNVARYLRDTQFQSPRVFQEFQQTRRALRELTLGGGGGGGPVTPINMSCVAVDNGWEEHGGGHVGYGRDVVQAQRIALATCQAVHGSCRIRSCAAMQ